MHDPSRQFQTQSSGSASAQKRQQFPQYFEDEYAQSLGGMFTQGKAP